jgi:hypothetical protein
VIVSVSVLIISLVALASVGGAGVYLAPAILPLQGLAARRSPRGPFLIVWSFLAAATAAEGTWGLVYVTIGEVGPLVWLLPLLAGVAAAFFVVAVPRTSNQTGRRAPGI